MAYPPTIASPRPHRSRRSGAAAAEDAGLRIAAVAAPVRAQVVRNLREAILNRTFEPGQRLIERQLCEMTGVSRTSIREALRQLETEGLVVMIPNRGPIVAKMSLEEVSDLYEVRGVLEGLAARRFTETADDDELATLQASVDRLAEAARAEAFADTLQRLNDVYAVLLAGSENAILRSVLESLHQRIAFVRTTSLARSDHSAEIVREVRAFTEAIAARDPEQAARLSEEHVGQAATRALRGLGDGD